MPIGTLSVDSSVSFSVTPSVGEDLDEISTLVEQVTSAVAGEKLPASVAGTTLTVKGGSDKQNEALAVACRLWKGYQWSPQLQFPALSVDIRGVPSDCIVPLARRIRDLCRSCTFAQDLPDDLRIVPGRTSRLERPTIVTQQAVQMSLEGYSWDVVRKIIQTLRWVLRSYEECERAGDIQCAGVENIRHPLIEVSKPERKGSHPSITADMAILKAMQSVLQHVQDEHMQYLMDDRALHVQTSHYSGQQYWHAQREAWRMAKSNPALKGFALRRYVEMLR